MHTTWANDPVNSPNHYTRSHPGMECIELTADTSFCLGNAIKYLWRYHSKGRPVEDLEKARWYLCRVIDYDEKIAWTRQQHAILDTLANDPAIPDAELWFSGKPYEQAAALAICRSCPVIGECRRFADEHNRINGYQLQGIWGGRRYGVK